MHYRTLGRTGIKVSPYGLGSPAGGVDRQPRPRRRHPDDPQGARRRDQPRRHRRRVLAGRIRGRRREGAQGASGRHRAGDQGEPPDGRRPQPARRVTEVDNGRRRGLPAAAADRPHRPVPDPAPRPGHRHRGDAVGTDGPDPQRQGPCHRLVDDPGLADRRGPVGRRAARTGALPHRAGALLDPEPQHRARGASGGRDARHRHAGLGPARARDADRTRA